MALPQIFEKRPVFGQSLKCGAAGSKEDIKAHPAGVSPLSVELEITPLRNDLVKPRHPWAGEHGESYSERLKRQSEEWEKQEQKERGRRSLWQKRIAKRQWAVDEARVAVQEAKKGRLRARDGGYAGVSRSEWTRRWRNAQAELKAAEKTLEALPEEARRAGVPPGWLRDARSSQTEENKSSRD